MAWPWLTAVRKWTAHFLLALAAVVWACGGGASGTPKPSKKEPSAACKHGADNDAKSGAVKSSGDKDDSDGDDDNDDDDEGVHFDLAGACAKLTGGVSYTYQTANQTASGLPLFVNRNGTVSRGVSSNSVSANIGLETIRQTNLGELKTSVAAEWSKVTALRTAPPMCPAGASACTV